MSIKSVMNEIITPNLKHLGFNESDKGLSDVWIFERDKGEVKQYIQIKKSSNRQKSITIQYYTSVNRAPINGGSLIGKDSYWWSYSDKESLKNIMIEFLQITLEKGLSYLDDMSTPLLEIKEGLYDQLSTGDIERKAKEFALTYGLELKNKDSLISLEKIIVDKKEITNEVDWQFIVSASAFLGEFIRNTIGGEWERDNDTDSYKISGIKDIHDLDPLSNVVYFWSKPSVNIYSLIGRYEKVERIVRG